MDAQEYCEEVEQKYRAHKKLLSTIPILENNSSLISLLESGSDFFFEPSFMKDYKYLVREAVSYKIERINEKLQSENKKLVIRSVWRSFEHQRLIWDKKVAFTKKKHPEMQPEEITELVSYFIAPPTKSLHSTGGAVDALIYDKKNDCIMDFGTNNGLDIHLNDKCYPYHPHISPKAKENRKLLINLFEEESFVVDIKEYWHFDYGNEGWAVAKGKDHAFYDIIKD